MIYILIACAVTAVDQITKALVRSYMPVGESYNIIGGFLKIVHVENEGAAFGMFEGQTRFLLVLPALIILGAVFFVFRSKSFGDADMPVRIAVTMVASGGIGNLIDRLLFSSVTDMISFSFFPPVFNVADISVTLGCALLIIAVLRKSDDNG